MNIEDKVKKANRLFYDTVSASYDDIDGRRSQHLVSYLSDQLDAISRRLASSSILDLGCGSGFVSRVASDYFQSRYAIDISYNIINAIDDGSLHKINADLDFLPIKDKELGTVVTFAVLHHCPSYGQLFREVYRVLNDGGIYYSDHDMDSAFYSRFKPLLKVYRGIFSAEKRYKARFLELTEEIYCYSEYHQNGIPSDEIGHLLRSIGFRDVSIQYHWYGLSPLTDLIFGKRAFKIGNAPLVRIIATK